MNKKDKFNLGMYVDGLQRSPLILDYNSVGSYMNFEFYDCLGWRGVSLDNDGVPINEMLGNNRRYFPITVCNYGLEQYTKFIVSKDEANLKNFIKIAKWIIKQNSLLYIRYDHHFFPERFEIIKGPWLSAMAQGMACSILRRYSYISGENMMPYIHSALTPFQQDVDSGGIARKVIDGMTFYEEYPTALPSLVLNGFMFSLIGIYDSLSFDENNIIHELYRQGMNTLEKVIAIYDLGSGTSYDLSHLYFEGRFGPNIAKPSYHRLHTTLLSTLSFLNARIFDETVIRWDKYLQGYSLKDNS